MSSRSKRPGRVYKIRGMATKAKRKTGSGGGGAPIRPGFKMLKPPGGTWWDPITGKVKDSKF